MIALHSISKELGKGHQRTLVLDDIDLLIPDRARLVILGQSGSGKTTFLNILNGSVLPTRGWVARRATVSAPLGGLLRHASGPMTARQLAHRLARLYGADEHEVADFVAKFIGFEEGVLDIPLRSLTTPSIRRNLNYALFYGLPCDYYLFDNVFTASLKGLATRLREAFYQRRKNSGMILATSRPDVARAFGGTGCILLGGKLIFFDSLREAIAAFEQLEAEHPVVVRNAARVPMPQGEDE